MRIDFGVRLNFAKGSMRVNACPRQLLTNMKSIALLLLVPFLSHLAVAQQAAPRQDPCEGKPISQRQLEDCAASLYKEADVHLNKVYRKLVQYMTDDLTRAQKRGDQNQIKYEENRDSKPQRSGAHLDFLSGHSVQGGCATV